MPLVKKGFDLSRVAFMPTLVFMMLIFGFCPLMGAQRNPYHQDPQGIAIKEVRSSIENLRHEVNNHETEIRIFEEKLTNIDSIIESVRDQLCDSNRLHKEQLKGSSTSLESKITTLETTAAGLVADLKLFKNHSNETVTALTHYKQKIGELEKVIHEQNQNMEHLQAAMTSLMEALQVKTAASLKIPSETGTSYKVKSGDSLEKIARHHRVSIQALKEINGLTNDRIIIGKTLVIPENNGT